MKYLPCHLTAFSLQFFACPDKYQPLWLTTFSRAYLLPQPCVLGCVILLPLDPLCTLLTVLPLPRLCSWPPQLVQPRDPLRLGVGWWAGDKGVTPGSACSFSPPSWAVSGGRRSCVRQLLLSCSATPCELQAGLSPGFWFLPAISFHDPISKASPAPRNMCIPAWGSGETLRLI